MRKNKGITLIALVVTIIVLLILAGISISMLTGENGIIKKAAAAKEETNTSSELEYLQTKAYEILTEYYVGNKSKSENEYLLEKIGSIAGVTAVNAEKGTVTYNGKVYDLTQITGENDEQRKVTAAGLKRITVSNATTSEEKEMLNNSNVKMIVKDSNNCQAIIPNGFYYVKGTPTEGMVISDVFGDDDNNTKGGNQFVWIPCNGGTLTYEKDSSKENNGLASFWKDDGYSGVQWYYNVVPDGSTYTNIGEKITDWSDDGGDEESVKKYGGFYVARFEAGVPSTAGFYADGVNKTTYTYDGSKNAAAVETMSPVSKKGNQSWNYISQTRAVKVSQNMYPESTSSVKSRLIDSYAWDTTVRWLCDSGNKYDSVVNGNTYKLGKNSTDFGNYYNNKKITANTLYAFHRYDELNATGKANNVNKGNNRWGVATVYKKGTITSGGNIPLNTDALRKQYTEFNRDYDTTNFDSYLYKELATGASDQTKIKEIYDMAGNMWEWTTETGKHQVTKADGKKEWDSYEGKNTFAVLRGGSFYNFGGNAVSHRSGSQATSWPYINIGFRVVLYIQ